MLIQRPVHAGQKLVIVYQNISSKDTWWHICWKITQKINWALSMRDSVQRVFLTRNQKSIYNNNSYYKNLVLYWHHCTDFFAKVCCLQVQTWPKWRCSLTQDSELPGRKAAGLHLHHLHASTTDSKTCKWLLGSNVATKFKIIWNLATLPTQNLYTIFSKSKEPETYYLINSTNCKVQTEIH